MALIHFTRSKNALFSILKYGFFYLHNETGLLRQLVGNQLVSEDLIATGGMVCFTDLPLEASSNLRQTFGHYGIGVTPQWVEGHGLRKVMYVDVNGPVFASLRTIFQENYPESLANRRRFPENPQGLDGLAQSIVLTNPAFLEQAGHPRTYVDLMRMLGWMQTNVHHAESEWRLRNPYSAAAISTEAMTRAQLVAEYIVSIEAALSDRRAPPEIRSLGVLTLSCPISRSALEFVYVPRAEVEEIQERVQSFANCIRKPYAGLPVIGYD